MNVPNWREVEPGVYSAGQPGLTDWHQIAAAGISAVINLRPASELGGVDEGSVVRSHGLEYHELPISSAADLNVERVTAFAALLQRLHSAGVLVHCGSGNRVGAVFALARGRKAGVSAAEAIEYGRRAGLTGLEPQVAALLRSWREPVT